MGRPGTFKTSMASAQSSLNAGHMGITRRVVSYLLMAWMRVKSLASASVMFPSRTSWSSQ